MPAAVAEAPAPTLEAEIRAGKRPLGHLLYGTEGEPRDSTQVAYYHRADRLRAASEAAGFESVLAYTRRSPAVRSSIRRLINGRKWVPAKFGGCRAVYAASSEPAALAGWALKGTGVPVLYDVHTPPVGEKWLQFKLNPSARAFAVYVEASFAELVAIRNSDYIIWSSLIQVDYYKRRGFPQNRLREVRHGVDLALFDIGRPQPADKRRVCYLGTMLWYQGAERLVEAFERAGREKLHLKMIGFTERDEALRRRADVAGVETVEQMPHERLKRELAGCHCTAIVAHPMNVRYKNGAAPTKWPESLALGRPILSVDAYDTAQLIRDLRVGWVVENTIEGLVGGMHNLAEAPFEEIAAMGSRARAEAGRNYGWETIGRRFVSVVQEATKRH